MEADILVYPCFFALPREEWELVVVHELAHCVCARMWALPVELLDGKLVTRAELDYNNEQLTQRIANIAMGGER